MAGGNGAMRLGRERHAGRGKWLRGRFLSSPLDARRHSEKLSFLSEEHMVCIYVGEVQKMLACSGPTVCTWELVNGKKAGKC